MDEHTQPAPGSLSPIQVPEWLLPPDWQQKPNIARIYDYFLGGKLHFPADRAMAERLMQVDPDCFQRAQANRRFLQRSVRFLCEQGISQFLDLGSGLPTVGNVHEIALECNPHARTLYIDSDPVVAMHTIQFLREQQLEANVLTLQADVSDPEFILASPKVQAFLDFQQPIALLCVAILHFLTDDHLVAQAMQYLRDALAPGSYLVIAHASLDGASPELVEQYETTYAQSVATFKGRSHTEITALFGDFELVPPGIVWLPMWHPASADDLMAAQPDRTLIRGGIGRKR